MRTQKESQALDHDYEQLLLLSKRMQLLSRQGNWLALLEKQSLYVAQVERLALQERKGDGQLSRRCAWIEDQLLEHAEEICAHLIGRRAEIGQLINSANQGNSPLLYDH